MNQPRFNLQAISLKQVKTWLTRLTTSFADERFLRNTDIRSTHLYSTTSSRPTRIQTIQLCQLSARIPKHQYTAWRQWILRYSWGKTISGRIVVIHRCVTLTSRWHISHALLDAAKPLSWLWSENVLICLTTSIANLYCRMSMDHLMK